MIKKLNSTHKKIISLIRDNPNITINQIIIATKISYRGVTKNLKYLKDANIIKRVGANKNGYWTIKEKHF